MNPIGAHVSVAGGPSRAFERIQAVGGECFQIFVKPNVQWRTGELSLEEVERFKTKGKKTGLGPIVAHASYLLNLASADQNLRQRSILTLAVELVRAARLGIETLVLHPGSPGEEGEKKGLERIAKGIDQVIDRAGVDRTKILLETMAGAGSQLGSSLEQLRDIIGRSRNGKNLGVCLDTCHIFAGGYDLPSASGYAHFFESFHTLIGLDRLKVIHANDSKYPLGSRVDRHEQIGRGAMGLRTFKRLLADPCLHGIPLILETPKGEKEGKNWDEINIRLLKRCRKEQ
jgi:deoxyribonuclease IV